MQVLPSVMYLWSWSLNNEKILVRQGLLRHTNSLWQSDIVILLRNVKLQNSMLWCLLLVLNLPTSPLLQTLFLSTYSSTQSVWVLRRYVSYNKCNKYERAEYATVPLNTNENHAPNTSRTLELEKLALMTIKNCEYLLFGVLGEAKCPNFGFI
jgi:hypothetical protein